MYFLLKTGIFHCYVSLPEGIIFSRDEMFPASSPPDWRLSDVKKTNESFCCLLFEAREDAAFQKKNRKMKDVICFCSLIRAYWYFHRLPPHRVQQVFGRLGFVGVCNIRFALIQRCRIFNEYQFWGFIAGKRTPEL